MGVVGSPHYKNASASCRVLEGDGLNRSTRSGEMDPNFLRSWVYVVAASDANGPAPPRAHKLAHGSFQQNNNSKVRRDRSNAVANVGTGESYRSFLAKMFLGFGGRGQSQQSVATAPRSTVSTVPTAPAVDRKSHFQAKSLMSGQLMSGQVTGDSTVEIGTGSNNSHSRGTTTTSTQLAAPEPHILSRPTAASPMKTLLKNTTSRFHNKKKISNFKSLGVFDFPGSNRNQLLRKRQAVLKSKKNAYGAPTVKNLGRFNFDLKSEISNTMISRTNTFDSARNNTTNTSPPPRTARPIRGNVLTIRTVQSNFTVELEYWQGQVANLSKLYGENHTVTRQSRLSLGNTLFKWGDYNQAIEVFQSILDHLEKHQSLLAACCLEKIGSALAHQRHHKHHSRSHSYVKEALLIRYQCLGPLHVDTIETMNVLGLVYFKLKLLEDAREAWREVYVLRQAMFGTFHPAVSVSAQQLGQVHAARGEKDTAREYYQRAQAIYQEMNVRATNPALVSVQKDIQALDQETCSPVKEETDENEEQH